MSKTNFKQYDTRWGKLPYPRLPHDIKKCGCGEVSIANCITESSKYAKQTPKTIQPYCKQYAAPNGDGTYWSGIPAMMKHYGMTHVMEHANMSSLWKELAKGGRVAIYLMGTKPGGYKGVHWTSCGHYISSTDYKYDPKTGKHKLYIKDSNSSLDIRNGWHSYEAVLRNDVVKVWSGKLPVEKKKAAKEDPLQPWFDAMTTQYNWSKNQRYEFNTHPNVENSKEEGTCITFPSVSLQRINLLPKNKFFYLNPKTNRIAGNGAAYVLEHTEIYQVFYPNKTVKQLWKEGKIKIGDIVGYDDPAYHTMVFMGFNSKGEPIYNTMGHKKGLKVTYPAYAKRKVNMIVRIKKVR